MSEEGQRTKAIVEKMVADYEAKNPETRPTVFAWVIETGGNRYWDGRRSGIGVSTTTDPNEAVRFARAEDASRVIHWMFEEYQNYLVARQHGWLA